MEPYDIIDKYYNALPNLKNILVRHSEKVAERSLIIADRHPELKADKIFLKEGRDVRGTRILL